MIEILSAYEVTKEDIAQALELDRISYDEVYYLDVETCLAYHKKNPLIYIMLPNTPATAKRLLSVTRLRWIWSYVAAVMGPSTKRYLVF